MDRVQLFRRARRYWVRYTQNGRQARKPLETEDANEAEIKRAEMEARLRRGLLRGTAKISMSFLVDEYLEHTKIDKTMKGWNSERVTLQDFLSRSRIQGLQDLTPGLVQEYLDGRSRRDGLQPKTLNNIRGYLHAVMSFAIQREYADFNPIVRVPRYRDPRKPIIYLTSEQIREVLKKLAGTYWEPVVATFIFAGLRRSELVWLTWADIDLARGLIYVRAKEVEGSAWSSRWTASRPGWPSHRPATPRTGRW